MEQGVNQQRQRGFTLLELLVVLVVQLLQQINMTVLQPLSVVV